MPIRAQWLICSATDRFSAGATVEAFAATSLATRVGVDIDFPITHLRIRLQRV
jgi:poly(3-hydroxybutyrate) depolymerase